MHEEQFAVGGNNMKMAQERHVTTQWRYAKLCLMLNACWLSIVIKFSYYSDDG